MQDVNSDGEDASTRTICPSGRSKRVYLIDLLVMMLSASLFLGLNLEQKVFPHSGRPMDELKGRVGGGWPMEAWHHDFTLMFEVNSDTLVINYKNVAINFLTCAALSLISGIFLGRLFTRLFALSIPAPPSPPPPK